MKISNLPDWIYYQGIIEDAIKSYIKSSGIRGYSSITGDETVTPVDVGPPSANDPRPKVVVALVAIEDKPQVSNSANRRYTDIGSKVHTQSIPYNHDLLFSLEVVSDRYETCINLANTIKRGFRPSGYIHTTYYDRDYTIQTSLDNYSLSVKEDNGQIVDFIASYSLRLVNVSEEPLESWEIGTDSNIDQIDLDREHTIQDLDDSDAEFDTETNTIT